MLPILEQPMELMRWLHVLFGIVWIGMLYYFNFCSTPYLNDESLDKAARSTAIQHLMPRVLWWFRWGAAFTFLTGVILLYMIHRNLNVYIIYGSLLGVAMAANVWFIIWPKQQIVMANAKQVAEGGEPLAEFPEAKARAACASRHNTLFSIPMLLFMVSSAHVGGGGAAVFSNAILATILGVLIIAALEVNAVIGKIDYIRINSIPQVIGVGFVLSLVLAIIAEYL